MKTQKVYIEGYEYSIPKDAHIIGVVVSTPKEFKFIMIDCELTDTLFNMDLKECDCLICSKVTSKTTPKVIS